MKTKLNKFKLTQLFFYLIFLSLPIYIFLSLKIFPIDTSYIEKYLIILFVNFVGFFFLYNFSKNNYLISNLKYFLLTIFNLIYSKLLFFDSNLFFSSEVTPYITVNIFYLFFSFVLINRFFYTNKLLLIQFIFYLSIFEVEIFGLYVVYLFYKYKFDFKFNTPESKLFKFIPIASIALKGLTLLGDQYDFLWRSFIRRPYSGEARFYDMQWNLLYIKCNSGLIEGEKLLFGSFMDCPPIYSPFFDLLVFDLNLKIATIVTFFIFFLFSIFGYIKIINKYSDNYILITLLFLSPPVNFMFYQGNFDILPFFIVLIIYSQISNNYLKIILIFLISLIEIHPISLLIGFIFAFYKEKKIREFTFGLFLIFLFMFYLFYDFEINEFSNNFLGAQLGQSTYVNDIFSSYGLKLDLFSIAQLLNLNIYFAVFLFLLLLYLFFPKISFDNNLSSYELLPLSLWFMSTIVLENPAYRLSLNIILFFFIFDLFANKIKYFLLIAFFLNPSPFYTIKESIEFHVINSYSQLNNFVSVLLKLLDTFEIIIVLLNRAGLCLLTIVLLRQITNKVFNIKNVNY